MKQNLKTVSALRVLALKLENKRSKSKRSPKNYFKRQLTLALKEFLTEV